jgi:hypothetical protein
MAISRTSLRPSLQSFDDLSRFLRQSFVDEESRQLRENVSVLAVQIDHAVRTRRTGTDSIAITNTVDGLVGDVRQHQIYLTGLGAAWHMLTEFRIYRRSLRHLIHAAAAWQQSLERRSPSERDAFDAFERQAWRTLGDALLVIDMYEQAEDAQTGHQAKPLGGTGLMQRFWGLLRGNRSTRDSA